MYFVYKIEDSQVVVTAPEAAFFKVAERGFPQIIAILNECDSYDGYFKLHPQTKREANWMIEVYCELVKVNQPIPNWLVNYFYQAFDKILAGEPSKKALGLIALPHRPKQSHKEERDRKIHEEVSLLMQKGVPLFHAALEISEKYNLHESNIQKIYSVIKKAVEIESSFKGDDVIPF